MDRLTLASALLRFVRLAKTDAGPASVPIDELDASFGQNCPISETITTG